MTYSDDYQLAQCLLQGPYGGLALALETHLRYVCHPPCTNPAGWALPLVSAIEMVADWSQGRDPAHAQTRAFWPRVLVQHPGSDVYSDLQDLESDFQLQATVDAYLARSPGGE